MLWGEAMSDDIRNEIEEQIEKLRLTFNSFVVTGTSRAWQSLAERDVVPAPVAAVLINKGNEETLRVLQDEIQDAIDSIEKIKNAVAHSEDETSVNFLVSDLKQRIFTDQQLHAFELLSGNDLQVKGLPPRSAFQKTQDKTWFKNYVGTFMKFSSMMKSAVLSFMPDYMKADEIGTARSLPCFSGDYVRAGGRITDIMQSLKQSIVSLSGAETTPLMRKLHTEKVDKLFGAFRHSVEQNQTLGQAEANFGIWHQEASALYRKVNLISERLKSDVSINLPKMSDFSKDFIEQFSNPEYAQLAMKKLEDENSFLNYSTTLPEDLRNSELSMAVTYIAEKHPELINKGEPGNSFEQEMHF